MLRVACVLIVITVATVVCLPAQALSLALRLPSRRTIPVAFHRFVCRMMDVRISVVGEKVDRHPLLVIANHVSWLDVPVIGATAPVVFVAKREIASWPVFGLLAKLQRTVFVDRERRHKTHEVNAEIAGRMAEGDPVLLFGEGTSSDGNRVLPFRTALIGAAREALTARTCDHVLIQPLSLAYVGLQGLPMGRQHRSVVAWIGDIPLWPHLLGVLRRGGIDVVVKWGEPVAYESGSDRKAVAKAIEQNVRQLTIPALRGRPVDKDMV